MDEHVFACVHVIRRQAIAVVMAVLMERFKDDSLFNYLYVIPPTIF